MGFRWILAACSDLCLSLTIRNCLQFTRNDFMSLDRTLNESYSILGNRSSWHPKKWSLFAVISTSKAMKENMADADHPGNQRLRSKKSKRSLRSTVLVVPTNGTRVEHTQYKRGTVWMWGYLFDLQIKMLVLVAILCPTRALFIVSSVLCVGRKLYWCDRSR